MLRIPAAILFCSLYLSGFTPPARGDELKSGGWTPEAMLAVKQVGGVQVSPDGKKVAFVVRRAVIEGEKSEFVAQIHVATPTAAPAIPADPGRDLRPTVRSGRPTASRSPSSPSGRARPRSG